MRWSNTPTQNNVVRTLLVMVSKPNISLQIYFIIATYYSRNQNYVLRKIPQQTLLIERYKTIQYIQVRQCWYRCGSTGRGRCLLQKVSRDEVGSDVLVPDVAGNYSRRCRTTVSEVMSSYQCGRRLLEKVSRPCTGWGGGFLRRCRTMVLEVMSSYRMWQGNSWNGVARRCR